MFAPDQLCVERDGSIRRLCDDSQVAIRWQGNPLAHTGNEQIITPGQTTIVWSGTLGDDLRASHPMNWMRPGQEALAELVTALGCAAVAGEATVLIQPHSRHVLSDTQTAYNFMQDDSRSGSLGLALSVATLLEPSMFDPIEDHLVRIFETLGCEASMVLLGDARVIHDEHDPDGRVESVPLGCGGLPRELMIDLARTHLSPDALVVLCDGPIDSQLAWLGLGIEK